MRPIVWTAIPLLMLACCGCIGSRPAHPAATQPATAIDTKYADPAYWLAEPATAKAGDTDFSRLWQTCEDVARAFLFRIDRRDYRGGLLVTEPMISKQFFEPWRRDAGTFRDVEEASLATIRRTIFFQFSRTDDGRYEVVPKVLVERVARVEADRRAERQEADLPTVYWYALRRDGVMEENLARSIRHRVTETARADSAAGR